MTFVLTLVFSGNAFAALAGTVQEDTISYFSGSWSWSPEEASTSVIGKNWSTSLGLVLTGDTWNGTLSVGHLVNPHTGETLPDIITKTFSFNNTAYGNVFSENFSIAHPGPEGHSDDYSFVFNRSKSSDNTSITLSGIHPTPIPAAAWLLGSGLLSIVGIRRKKNL
jgi:hypothetical protein